MKSIAGASDDVVTEAVILILELLGADYQLVLRIGDGQLCTRVNRDLTALTPGLRVPVILRLRYLHLFDALSSTPRSLPPKPVDKKTPANGPVPTR